MAKSGGKQFVSRKRTKQPNRPKGGIFKHKKSSKGIKAPQRPQQGPKSGARAEQPFNSPLLGECVPQPDLCSVSQLLNAFSMVVRTMQHLRQSATECLPL